MKPATLPSIAATYTFDLLVIRRDRANGGRVAFFPVIVLEVEDPLTERRLEALVDRLECRDADLQDAFVIGGFIRPHFKA